MVSKVLPHKDTTTMSIEGTMIEDDDPMVSESESESEEDENVKLTESSKKAVYNNNGLVDKLGDIIWSENAVWIQKLSININQEQEVDVNDDLTRELDFYTQALDGARQALARIQSMGLPFLGPSDYYAEMVKSDTHMEKVKGRLLAEKRKAEEADERRKARENKKISKEIQVQKQKERKKKKKDEIESVKIWRMQRHRSGFSKDENNCDFSLGFEDGKPFSKTNKKRSGVAPADRSGGKAKQGFGGKGKQGFGKKKDRHYKDLKFGFGGRKGLKKQNTAETTNNFRSFPSKKKQKK